METIITAINNKPAGEGFGSVLLSGLLAVGVMALIYGVLELMNHVRKKKDSNEKPDVQPPLTSGSRFARVLEKQIEQRNEKKHDIEDDDRDLRA